MQGNGSSISLSLFSFSITRFSVSISQKVEDYTKDASDLITKMADLHRRLISLDGFRMSESDDDLESYWGMSNELTAHARHILQSGECYNIK